MTLREWEKEFTKALHGLSKEDTLAALEYYRELYGDKTDAGCAPEAVVAEFGSPTECAQKILAENAETAAPTVTDALPNGMPTAENASAPEKKNGRSVAAIVGLVLFAILVLVPVVSVYVSVLAAFAVIAVACVILAPVSLLYALIAPVYYAVQGISWIGVFGNIGLGLFVAGAALLLGIALIFVTKFMVLFAAKAIKRMFSKGGKV